MPYNPSWNKWIVASIIKHFDDGRGTLSMYIEGQSRPNKNPDPFFELRLNGPTSRTASNGYHKLDVSINALLQVIKSPSDLYLIDRLLGQLIVLFDTNICCYRYGDQIEDDSSYLGTLVLSIDFFRGRESIEVNKFGEIIPDEPLMQASIEAHYHIELKG